MKQSGGSSGKRRVLKPSVPASWHSGSDARPPAGSGGAVRADSATTVSLGPGGRSEGLGEKTSAFN